MNKWLRISFISCALAVLHHLYITASVPAISLYDYFRFLFSDMAYCESIGFGQYSIYRNASIILLFIWWMIEILRSIAETNRYASMVIHRYVSITAYVRYLLCLYSRQIASLLSLHLVCCIAVYLSLSTMLGNPIDFSGLPLVLLHYGKMFSFYLLLICLINLFDLMNKGQIAYIAASLVIVSYVFSEALGLHTTVLFYHENIVLTLAYILFFALCLFPLRQLYQTCIERKDIL